MSVKLPVEVTSDDRGGYVAHCPVLPGMRSRGSSAGEAVRGLCDASKYYIAAVTDFLPERIEQKSTEV